MTRSQSGVVGAPEVVDDLHGLARVHAGQVGQQLEAELGLVVEGGQDRDHVAGRDPDLGLVVALADGPRRAGRRTVASRRSLNRRSTIRRLPARSGRSPGPASGRAVP